MADKWNKSVNNLYYLVVADFGDEIGTCTIETYSTLEKAQNYINNVVLAGKEDSVNLLGSNIQLAKRVYITLEDDNRNEQILETYENTVILDKLQEIYDLISKDGKHYFNYGFRCTQGMFVMSLMKVVKIEIPLEKAGSLMDVKVRLKDVNSNFDDKIVSLSEIYVCAKSYFKEIKL